MYAQLGDIEFELITYFSGLSQTATYNYATHERINNKPLLQYLGEGLQELTLKLNLHASLCVPEEELKALQDEAALGTPLKFIKGNGEYVGVFCISEISSVTEQTTDEGDLIYIQVELRLLEYAGKIIEKNAPEGGLKTK